MYLNVFIYNLYIVFGFRIDPPNIDRILCDEFEEKINFQLLPSTSDSEPEDENYFEWEAV